MSNGDSMEVDQIMNELHHSLGTAVFEVSGLIESGSTFTINRVEQRWNRLVELDPDGAALIYGALDRITKSLGRRGIADRAEEQVANALAERIRQLTE